MAQKVLAYGGISLAAAVVAAMSMGACADALRLEPPDGGLTVGVGGGGGAAPCITNYDCPFPTPVCDEIRQECVECLVIEDCAHKPSTVCSKHQCVCEAEGETFCEPNTCVDMLTSSEHCGSCDHACFGACADGECVDAWEPIPLDGAPSARGYHVGAWVASSDGSDGRFVVWGGSSDTGASNTLGDGAIYDPNTFEWTPITPVGAPSPRQEATGVVVGDKLVVWGGRDGGIYFNDGGVFDPFTNTWKPTTLSGAPSPRIRHTAVSTGTEMVVWGGVDDMNELASGGRYDVAADSWTSIATAAVPRRDHVAVFTGTNMWIHGGFGDVGANPDIYLPGAGEAGGQTWSQAGDSWDVLNTVGEPSARAFHTAVWDGSHMLLFGGYDGNSNLANGYQLGSNNMWMAFSGTGPVGRRSHTAVFVSDPNVMVVFGGRSDSANALGDGGVYDVATNAWTKSVPTGIDARWGHVAAANASRMFVWGGFNIGNAPLRTGGIYNPAK